MKKLKLSLFALGIFLIGNAYSYDFTYDSLVKDCSKYNKNIKTSISLSNSAKSKLQKYSKYYESKDDVYQTLWNRKKEYYTNMIDDNSFNMKTKYGCDELLANLYEDYLRSKSKLMDFVAKVPSPTGLLAKGVKSFEVDTFEYRAERIYNNLLENQDRLEGYIKALKNISQGIDIDNNNLKKEISNQKILEKKNTECSKKYPGTIYSTDPIILGLIKVQGGACICPSSNPFAWNKSTQSCPNDCPNGTWDLKANKCVTEPVYDSDKINDDKINYTKYVVYGIIILLVGYIFLKQISKK